MHSRRRHTTIKQPAEEVSEHPVDLPCLSSAECQISLLAASRILPGYFPVSRGCSDREQTSESADNHQPPFPGSPNCLSPLHRNASSGQPPLWLSQRDRQLCR